MGSVQEISASGPSSRSALIRAELEKIVSSPVFARADRLSQFLRLIVDNSLQTGSEPLKETIIGAQVYGRTIGYDPKAEPIVRIEARRLRLKLEEYYAGPGSKDRVIITVPTGGYAPHFEIRPEPLHQVIALPTPQKSPSKPGFLSGATAKWAIIGLACLVCFAALWRWTAQAPKTMAVTAGPVTRLPGSELQPGLSPDGKRVAFAWNGSGGKYDIYIKLLNSAQMQRLTRGPGHSLFPAWSPDGRTIAFLRLLPSGPQQVLLLAASGGQERLLCTTDSAHPGWFDDPSLQHLSPGPAWSPDGKFLAVSDRANDGEPNHLSLISVTTGRKTPFTSPKAGDVGDYFPAFSPDGRTLAFVRETNQRGSSDIYAQNLANGSFKRVTFDSSIITGLAWISKRQLLFSSNRDGNILFWTVSSTAGKPEPLLGSAGQNVSFPSASPDGRVVVYAETFRNSNVWRVPLRTGERQGGPAVEIIASSTQNHSAQYSPDGKKIVFVSDRSGAYEIWMCGADGSDPASLFSANGAPVGTPRWSPDGSRIVFDLAKDGRSVIALVDVNSGANRILVSGTADYMMPSWSRDGRFIYYVSPTGSNQVQIWKRAVDGVNAVQLTRNGGGEAFESPDGAILYYLKTREGIWQVPSSGAGACDG